MQLYAAHEQHADDADRVRVREREREIRIGRVGVVS